MQKNLSEIAELVNGVLEGDGSTVITGVSAIRDAEPGDITFVGNPKYLPLLATTSASAVIVDHDAPRCDRNLIRADQPYIAFTQVLKLFAVEVPEPKGVHPSSVVGRDVTLGDGVALHAGVVLEDDCAVGDRSILYPGVFVGEGAVIGRDCKIYPRVVIDRYAAVGNNVIIHSGAVIGSRLQPNGAGGLDSGEDELRRAVVVEDDVEIGATVTIESGRGGAITVIGGGTKIDNLVHIGSGAGIGRNCIVVSQAGVGAGCMIGDGVTIAGQASILDGVSVGAGTIVAARAGVTENVGENQIVSGFPAASHDQWLRIYASMSRLPAMVKDIRDFKRRLQIAEDSNHVEPENY